MIIIMIIMIVIIIIKITLFSIRRGAQHNNMSSQHSPICIEI